jgi:Arc/MetJ-type ribon-helix-helix transcriptional regulator
MKYANVSVKFPEDLDGEVERFLEETGVYTNKSEFIKEAVRRHLLELNDEPAVAALRAEKMLARAEREPVSDDDLHDRLDALRKSVDEAKLSDAVSAGRTETAEEFLDQS